MQSHSVPGSADALSALCYCWAGFGLGCQRWREAAGCQPKGHESSSGLSLASSPHQNLCGPPEREDSPPLNEPYFENKKQRLYPKLLKILETQVL